MKTVVTVSRKWNNPRITTTISSTGISLEMDMDDFKEALKRELGSIAMVFTKGQLSQRIDDAVRSIIEGIKEESIKVVS